MQRGFFRPGGARFSVHTGLPIRLQAIMLVLLSVGLCRPVGAGMVMRHKIVAAPIVQPADGKPQTHAKPATASRSASSVHWPTCVRHLNDSALATTLLPEQRRALLAGCAS